MSEFATTFLDRAAIVTFLRRVDIANAQSFLEVARGLIAEDRRTIVLDLGVTEAIDSTAYPLHEHRSRRRRAERASSRAWMWRQRGQLGEACSSGGSGTGTETCPRGRASSVESSRARVRAQYLGASSRYRSRGQ